MKVRRSMLEGGLQGPAIPIELRHPFGRYLAWYIGQDVEQRGSMAGRMIQCEPHTAPDVFGAVCLHHTHALLGKVTCRGAIIRLQRTENLKGPPLLLANNAETAACVSLTQKRAGTKMTLSHPPILCGDCCEHRSQQRALLRMPIFTRN